MSREVDERIVEMRFDNRNFEQNVSNTMSTLEKLKRSLKFPDASKGFENVSAAAKKIDMNALGSGVESVRLKFSALEVMAVTALSNITNSVMHTAKNMISAFTIDPIKSGFQEYETQINAVQTILANTSSKGTTLDDVNAALDELNKYADLTIYNFTEMTRNIGTFTAAGIDLKTSVSAIQGIANLAAVSGSTSQQASTAMYQLSQALAAGTVKLMDWNSVVNAGMGGEVFQNALKKTSELLGTGAEAAIEAEGSFRESLKTGWLTSEVLTETLSKFTTSGANEYVAEYCNISAEAVQAALDAAEAQYGEEKAVEKASEALAKKTGKNKEEIQSVLAMAKTAQDAATKVKTFTQLMDTLKEAAQSGWTQTWELIIGDFGEAKELFTELSDRFSAIIGKSAEARNSILEGALTSKWEQFAKQIENTGVSLDFFEEKLKETLRAHNVPIDKLIEKYGSLGKAMAHVKNAKTYIIETLQKITGTSKETSKVTGEVTAKLEDMQKIVNQVIRGNYGNGADRIKKLTDAGYEYAQVQGLVNKIWERNGKNWKDTTLAAEDLTGVVNNLSDAELQSLGYTEEQVSALRELADQAAKTGTPLNELISNLEKPSGRELLIDSLRNSLNAISTVLGSVKNAWNEIFDATTEEKSAALYNIIEAIHSFTSCLILNKDQAEKLKQTFKGLFAIVDIVATIFGGGLKVAVKLVSAVLGTFNLHILDVTAGIGNAIVAFHDWLFENSLLAKGFDLLVDGIVFVVKAIKDFIQAFMTLPKVQSALTNLSKRIDEFKTIGKNFILGLQNGIVDGIKSIPGKLIELGQKMIDTLMKVLDEHSPSKITFEIGRWFIEGLINGITAAAVGLVNGLKGLGNTIVDWIKGLELSEKWNNVTNDISADINKMVNTIKKVVSKIELDKIFAGVISVAMIAYVKKLGDVLEAFSAPFEGLGNVFNSTSKFIDQGSKVLKTFSKTLKAFAFSVKANAIKQLAIAIAILVGSIIALSFIPKEKLLDSVTVLAMLSGILIVVAAAVEGLVWVASKLGGGTLDIAKISLALVGISTAMLILGMTIKSLGGMSPKQFQQGIVGLIGIVASLGVLLAVYGTLVKGKSAQNIDKLGGTLLKLSASLLLLAVVTKLIGLLKAEDMAKGVLFISLFTLFIFALTKMSAIAGRSFDKLGKSMIQMSIALGLMVVVVKLIGRLSFAEIGKGIIGLSAFSLFILALVGISRLAGNQMPKIGMTLISMAAAMLILVTVIKIISGISWGEMVKGLIGVGALSLFVYALIKMVDGINNAPKIALTLLALSVSIGILAGIAIMLSLVDLGGLLKGVAVIGILSLFMANMVKATRGANDCKGNLIVLTVAIGVMVASIAVLSMIKPSKLIAPVAALGILMGMFGLMAKLSSDIQSSLASIIAMTVIAGALAGLIYLLSGLPVQNVLAVGASLSALMLGMSAMMFTAGKMGSISLKAMGAIACLTLVVAALGGILYGLSVLNVKSSLDVAASISMLMITMSAALALTSVAGKKALVAVGALALMGLVVAELAVVLYGIQQFNIQPSLETVLSLSALILALSGACILLGVAGKLGLGAFIGIGALAVLIVSMGAIIAGIGYLATYIPEMEEFIDKGMPILEKIGLGLGLFLGNLIGGVLGGAAQAIMSVLPGIGTSLSEFMQNVQPFISMASTIDAGSLLAGIGGLSAAIVLLTAADLISGIASIFTGGFADLGLELTNFALGMMPFLNIMKTMDPAVVESAKSLAQMILIITAADLLQGISSWITGGKSITEFGEQLEPLGKSLKAFGETVKGIDEESVTAAANAGKMLAEMAATIPNSGGIASIFAGENDMETFSSQLTAFGKSIVDFSTTVSGNVSEESVTAAANAGEIMVKLAEKIPNTGGVVSWFTGDNKMSTFGAQLVTFGESIVGFSTVVSGNVNEEAVTAAANAGDVMIKLANKLPNTGGLITLFTGDNKMSTFGAQLVAFGESFSEYSSKMSGVNPDIVTSTTSAAESLVGLSKAVVEADGGWMSDNLGDFGNQIKSFGEKFAAFYESVSSINSSTLTSVVTEMNRVLNLLKDMNGLTADGPKSFANGLKSLGESGLNNFVSAFENGTTKINTAVTNMMKTFVSAVKSNQNGAQDEFKNTVDKCIKAIENKLDSFTKAGKKMATNLSKAIKQGSSDVKDAIKSLVESAISATKGYQSKFSGAGKDFGQGLVSGINSKKQAAYDAGYALGQAAVQGEKDGQKSNSPSKATMEAGNWLGEGLIIGMDKTNKKVYDAGVKMGQTGVRGLLDGQHSHSPSKDGEQAGEWLGKGDIIGMENTIDEVKEEGAKLGEAGVEGLVEATEKGVEEVGKAEEELSKASLEKLDKYWEDRLDVINKKQKDEKKQAIKMVDFQKDIVQQTWDIIKEYTDKWKSTSESLMNGSGIFNEVSKKEKVKSDTLVKNLKDQINELTEYNNVMASLQTRLANTKLADTIAEMGVDSLAQLKSLNSMTDVELTDYVKLFDTKYAMAEVAAVNKLNGMKITTQDKLSKLFGGVDIDLSDFQVAFDGSFESINKYLGKFVESGKFLTEGVAEGMKDGIQETKDAADTVIDGTLKETREVADIHSPSGLFRDEAGVYITQGIGQGMVDAVDSLTEPIQTIMSKAIGLIIDYYDEWKEAGVHLSEGLKVGILSQSEDIANAAAKLAKNALLAVKNTAAIKSPSRKMAELGKYMSLGLAKGIHDNTNIVNTESIAMAESVMRSTIDTLSALSTVANESLDIQPTIKPVVDMDGVRDIGQLEGNLNISLGKPIESLSQYMYEAQAKIEASNREVISAIKGLRDDLNAYCSRPDPEISLYVDSKRLSSSLARSMNQQLNILSKRGAH